MTFLPTFIWLVVLVGGVALIIEATNRSYVGTRQIVQIGVGVLLVLAFLANAWTGFSHWAQCEDRPYADECEDDEEDL